MRRLVTCVTDIPHSRSFYPDQHATTFPNPIPVRYILLAKITSLSRAPRISRHSTSIYFMRGKSAMSRKLGKKMQFKDERISTALENLNQPPIIGELPTDDVFLLTSRFQTLLQNETIGG